MLNKIDALFAQWDKPDSPGCAVGVIKDGQFIYQRGFGQASLEFDSPITPSTIFHVASVSKQFTCFAIALLAQEGRLSLDEDVHRYVPELPDYGASITLRHLMHHTSGLRDQWALLLAAGWRPGDVITTSDIMDIVCRQRALNFAPGAEFSYCNSGYTLLAQIAGRVSGVAFPEFCAERIFRPLGMNHTHFHEDHTQVVRNRAYSYNQAGDHFAASILSYANVGATSLFTTVEDLALWDENFYTGRVGGLPLIDQMHTRGTLNDGTVLAYAFGLNIDDYRGLRLVEHGGGDAGFRCVLTRFPEQRCTIVILGNVANADPITQARRIADLVLAAQLKDVTPSEQAATTATDVIISPEALADKAGNYYTASTNETMLLEVRDGKLVIANGAGLELRPITADRFVLAVAPEVQFTFVTTPAGEHQVHQLNGSAKPVIYEAIAPLQLTPAQLVAFTGAYYSPELNLVYTLTVREEQLILHQNKYGATVLRPMFVDGFKCDLSAAMGFPYSLDILFLRSADAVSGLHVTGGRFRNIRFERLSPAA